MMFHFLRYALIGLLMAGSLAGCGGGNEGGDTAERQTGAPLPGDHQSGDATAGGEQASAAERVRFLVIGDSGDGGPGAYAVGRAIGLVCAAKQGSPANPDRAGCDFVLGLGDNIYETGAQGVRDPAFVEKFEKPFAPVHKPFYMVLGNHDNTGFFAGDGANNDRGDVQVAYTYYDGAPTNRWRMPERYYHFDAGQTADGDPLVGFFALDSNPIAGGFADADPEYAYHTYGMNELNWLQDALGRSHATFKVAFAHHPYISNGQHGNAGNYNGVPGAVLPVLAGLRWKDFLQASVCDSADFFLAGHDHDLQVLKPVQGCGRTRFVISGAASKSRSLADRGRNAALFQRGGVLGFFWFEVIEARPDTGKPAQMCVEAYVVEMGADNLGVTSDGKTQPEFRHCFDKIEPVGLPENNDFRDKVRGGDAIPLPPPDASYQPAFAGPLGKFRSLLVSGLREAIARQPEGPQRRIMQRMLTGVDQLLGGLDGLSAAMMTGDANAINQALQSTLAAVQTLAAIETGGLPKPFNHLDDMFTALGNGLGNATAMATTTGTIEDIGFIAGPLVQLARNLHNILEGAEGGAAEVPVVAGLTRVLATVADGLSKSLAQLAVLDTTATGEVLVGTVQQTLRSVVEDVLLLESVDGATVPGDLLSSVLASETREVTAQLDRRVVGALGPLLSVVSPLTNTLRELLQPL